MRLSAENGHLTFTVEDAGRGFVPESTPRGAGMTNMSDRLEALGGKLAVQSRPGEGTRVTGRIPVDGPAAQAPYAVEGAGPAAPAQADSSRSGSKADFGM